ncbi:MAG: FtsX-like permease family protein [Cytophagales bacterium]|nr:FtsX-like permease family protein [Bernardetiaceae bacterium]MDW8203957.1 FtsX-like permease family protein [Cytophagales bacterium]
MLTYALLSLARKWRKLVSLVVIYALTVALFASAVFFADAIRKQAKHVLADLPELWVQQLAGGRLVPLKNNLLDSLRSIKGIKSLHGRIWGYWFDSATGAVFTIVAADSTLGGLPQTSAIRSVVLDTGKILIGSGLAQVRHISTGDFLSITDLGTGTFQFQIADQLPVETSLLSRDLIVMHPRDARQVLQYAANEITDLAVRVHNPEEIANIGKKISRLFPNLRVVAKSQLIATYEALFGWRGSLIMYGGLFALLAFLVLAWERASGYSREDRLELGVLKACGWQVEEVLQLKIIEGWLISFIATALGIILAWLHVFFADSYFIKPLMAGWSVLYPSFYLTPYVQFSSLLFIAILSIVPYIIATLVPAWKSAITDPAEIVQG